MTSERPPVCDRDCILYAIILSIPICVLLITITLHELAQPDRWPGLLFEREAFDIEASRSLCPRVSVTTDIDGFLTLSEPGELASLNLCSYGVFRFPPKPDVIMRNVNVYKGLKHILQCDNTTTVVQLTFASVLDVRFCLLVCPAMPMPDDVLKMNMNVLYDDFRRMLAESARRLPKTSNTYRFALGFLEDKSHQYLQIFEPDFEELCHHFKSTYDQWSITARGRVFQLRFSSWCLGQKKQSANFCLDKIVNVDKTAYVIIHAACEILPTNGDHVFFWNREFLRYCLGTQCTYFHGCGSRTLGSASTANFVSSQLFQECSNVFSQNTQITFAQMYQTSHKPFVRSNTPFCKAFSHFILCHTKEELENWMYYSTDRQSEVRAVLQHENFRRLMEWCETFQCGQGIRLEVVIMTMDASRNDLGAYGTILRTVLQDVVASCTSPAYYTFQAGLFHSYMENLVKTLYLPIQLATEIREQHDHVDSSILSTVYAVESVFAYLIRGCWYQLPYHCLKDIGIGPGENDSSSLYERVVILRSYSPNEQIVFVLQGMAVNTANDYVLTPAEIRPAKYTRLFCSHVEYLHQQSLLNLTTIALLLLYVYEKETTSFLREKGIARNMSSLPRTCTVLQIALPVIDFIQLLCKNGPSERTAFNTCLRIARYEITKLMCTDEQLQDMLLNIFNASVLGLLKCRIKYVPATRNRLITCKPNMSLRKLYMRELTPSENFPGFVARDTEAFFWRTYGRRFTTSESIQILQLSNAIFVNAQEGGVQFSYDQKRVAAIIATSRLFDIFIDRNQIKNLLRMTRLTLGAIARHFKVLQQDPQTHRYECHMDTVRTTYRPVYGHASGAPQAERSILNLFQVWEACM